MAVEIIVGQQDGEIVVDFPGIRRVVLPVVDGKVSTDDEQVAAQVLLDDAAHLPDDAGSYDPSQHFVEEVNAHLDRHPEQVVDVLSRERAGKARAGILAGPHAPADDSPADVPAEQEEG